MPGNFQSFFQGMAREEQDTLVRNMEKKRFPAGSTLLAEGDNPDKLYIIQSGNAEVYVADHDGIDQLVDHAGPGDALGEMSLFTGRPVSATVRAVSDLETLVLGGEDFDRLATAYPRIYRNLGMLLSNRLHHSHQRAMRAGAGNITLLREGSRARAEDEGRGTEMRSPPLLAYALACSVAWHTHRPIVLVVIGEAEPADLQPFATMVMPSDEEDIAPGARLVLIRAEGEYSDESLAATLDRLLDRYDQVLLMVDKEDPLPDLKLRTVYLQNARGPSGGEFGMPGTREVGEESSLSGPSDSALSEPASQGSRLTAIRGWAAGPEPARPDRGGMVYVPQPEVADLDAFRVGLLPINTACGRAIGWAARDLAGLKVGVALGAGSDKGYAHIGVLRVLAKAGIPIDYLAGTSVGSGVATAAALGYDADKAEELLDRLGASVFRLHLPGSSLLSNEGLREGIRSVLGDKRFEDLELPLAVVAADIVSGREVVFKSGLVWPALLSSMSIPGVFPPQRMGPYTLVDGGILNPVPVNVVAGMGAGRVIAVKLASQPAMPAIEGAAAVIMGRPPSLLKTLARTMEIMQSKIVTDTAAAATVLLEPDLHDAGDWREMRHFEVGRRYIERGEEVAQAALPRIASALPWLKY